MTKWADDEGTARGEERCGPAKEKGVSEETETGRMEDWAYRRIIHRCMIDKLILNNQQTTTKIRQEYYITDIPRLPGSENFTR